MISIPQIATETFQNVGARGPVSFRDILIVQIRFNG